MTSKLAALALMMGVAVVAARPAAAQAVAGGAGSEPAVQNAVAQATQPAPAPVADAATAAAPASGTSAVARFGPSVEGARLMAPARTQAEQRTPTHEPAYRRSAPGVALMIVGGALFLGGAIVNGQAGDALMVGGVVVAAIGLYQYLQ